MRLPNGFGSVYKLSGNRRNPWCARKTVGWTFDEEKQKSYPIYEFIGYFGTRKEALTALTDYNKDPYDLHNDTITFAELYEKWSYEHFPTVSDSNVKGYRASFKSCSPIHNMKIHDIKLDHLQQMIDSSGKNTPTLRKIKVMLGLMYDYAVMHEIVNQDKRDMIRYININKAGNPNGFDRKPFTKKEIQKLWDNLESNKYIQIPLILIYSGIRIGEFRELKKEDVHLDEKYFYIKEAKTESGIREVPIADKILPFLEQWMNLNDCEYIFSNASGKKFSDKNIRDAYWNPIMEQLNMNHRPHDTRHTCISLLTQAGIDERIIKQIVGHKGQGVTQIVYTHVDLQSKLDAINSI